MSTYALLYTLSLSAVGKLSLLHKEKVTMDTDVFTYSNQTIITHLTHIEVKCFEFNWSNIVSFIMCKTYISFPMK